MDQKSEAKTLNQPARERALRPAESTLGRQGRFGRLGTGAGVFELGLGLGLGLLVAGAGGSGCASARVRQVAAWEAAGDDAALKRALQDDSPEVRQAAAAAFVRYGAYDTGRPPILGTLGRSPSPEAKEAARKLFGVPPVPTPDPHGSGAGPGQAVIYLYRPAGDRGEARWLRIDQGTGQAHSVRLRPGRFLRYETTVGTHPVAIDLPDQEAPPTDDPNETYGQMRKVSPMQLAVASPAAGVYFVRELMGGAKPDLKVMPVPSGLAAVKPLKPADQADCDAAP
jgi:hypothetical protein